jgi:hypothetical protein
MRMCASVFAGGSFMEVVRRLITGRARREDESAGPKQGIAHHERM